MAVTSLRALMAGRVPASIRLTLSRLRHGELAVQRWPAERKRRRIADTVDADHEIRTVEGAVVARDTSMVWDADATRDAVRAALSSAKVEHVEVPSFENTNCILAIEAEHVVRLREAFRSLPDGAAWHVRVETPYQTRWLPAERAAKKIGSRTTRLVVRRRAVVPNGRYVDVAGRSEVVIELWDRLEGGEQRADGEAHRSGTRVSRCEPTTVPYLIEEQWKALARDETHVPALTLPHLMCATEPIDVVYTWVDGDDPAWLKRKAQALGQSEEQVNITADSASRFVSRDELRFSLRSLELYAPWVRHVYLVTDGQRPVWLAEDHPRLTVVDHQEIFTDPSALPVFNSHAIESQLHHIVGLSDRYLYLNDDVFFGRSVTKEVFFEANGVSKFYLSRATLDVGPVSSRDLPVLSGAKHNASLLAEAWGRSITNKFKHTPHTQNRKVLYEMEHRFPEVFEKVARSRIRHPDDHSIASALQHYYAYALGRAVPGSIRYAYIDITAEDAELPLSRLLRMRDMDVFCLNDTYADHEGHDRADRLGDWFLNEYFPLPSTFERASG